MEIRSTQGITHKADVVTSSRKSTATPVGEIEDLDTFAVTMKELATLRRQVVLSLLNGHLDKSNLAQLKEWKAALETGCTEYKKEMTLEPQSHQCLTVDLSYEIQELEKDIVFLTHFPRECNFVDWLATQHSFDFKAELQRAHDFLKGLSFTCFLTDRDGTINSYCGRYFSSTQGIPAAVFMTRFARQIGHPVILTAGPFFDTGIIDVSVTPDDIFYFAASKGREWLLPNGKIYRCLIEENLQEKFDLLYEKIQALVKREVPLLPFSGSGLQKKFGEITIALNNELILSKEKSAELFLAIEKIVLALDPNKIFFELDWEGKDLEISLKTGKRGFSKGDGVALLEERFNIPLKKGNLLVCGDTKSDLPMLEKAMEKNRETRAIFIAPSPELQESVQKICLNSCFLSHPDVLVTALNEYTK